MPKRHDEYEEWAIKYLGEIIKLNSENRDALPGSVVELVRRAIVILKKRRRTNG